MYDPKVNAEAIFEVCKTHIPTLGKTIGTLMDDIKNQSQGA